MDDFWRYILCQKGGEWWGVAMINRSCSEFVQDSDLNYFWRHILGSRLVRLL